MLPVDQLTPRRIVKELDKYIIGQTDAKKAVAIALRNRWRRQQIPGEMQKEIMPNNIILIGPTGIGKTEIARRLSRLANAPFIKVEASKFTEVGYVGRDVESMVRELMNIAVAQIRQQMLDEILPIARQNATGRILDILIPSPKITRDGLEIVNEDRQKRYLRNRDKMRVKLLNGDLDDREIEFVNELDTPPHVEVMSNFNFDILDINISEMLSNMLPGKRAEKTVKMNIPDAMKHFVEIESNRLVSRERVVETATRAVEDNGIVFIDEIDKIATVEKYGGIDVSRSGVQRDLLPIVEGSSVPTRYGSIDTSHILFISAGAFSTVKPSDLIPELQGRFPIRVELRSLTQNDFELILTEPENALITQYKELFRTEGTVLSFQKDAIREIAYSAAMANEKMEDIGARRLHTIMNALLEEYLFELPEGGQKKIVISGAFVRNKLSKLIENEDLSRFIL
ncbi:MAG: ATP-dependent protease ATPase subunit HslU [Candidatus Cloacimonetes bacterium]|nr:ATP-dependent protease ATPase subunit HslU [Candidatus Cloacimonadota bacterium]